MGEGEYRTFVKLGRYELEILRRFQRWEKKCTGKKPPMSRVIRGVIRDYWTIMLTLTENADDELRKKLMEDVTTELEFSSNIDELETLPVSSILSMKLDR